MQQVKTYKPGFLKGSARDQFFRDLGKMVKAGWHVHTITHDGVGTDQVHSSQLKVLYDTNLSARSELGTQDHFGPARPDSSRGQPDAGEQ